MKCIVRNILDQLIIRYSQLRPCTNDIEDAFMILKDCYNAGGKLLICGNGGSAADSEHIVGELMKGFKLKREICSEDVDRIKLMFPEDVEYLSNNLQRALPAISLVSQSAISSAYINDISADMVFAQQVYGYGNKEDVLIGLSTSGNSRNVINAIKVAKVLRMKTISMTGEEGGLMKKLCDVTINVPSKETYLVQEYHLPVYHALCAMIELEYFG
jgi:D-sedoheptulose 7-phosphate isomerase